jgi:class 3 adenylate cyclase/tetratricopeptide (TPR) repeat protein
MSQGERRLAAIMFTDIVGYTSLSQKNEALAMRLLEEHRSLVRPYFPKYNGREVKTIGDAFLVEFASALEAIRCAFDIQQSVHEMNNGRPQDRQVQIRIGIHVGDVIHSQNDVYGDAVNIASRIEPLAVPGGICVSQQVYDQVQNKFEFPLESLGKKELKNVGEPVEVFRVVPPWEKSTGVEAYPPNRIAILPFASFSPDPNDGFFADGITDEIISAAAGISGLNVISRTSVVGYKGTTKKVGEIGRELKVGSILEGTFKKAGNRIRVTTQLIDVAQDRHLWAQNYDRNLDDVFEVQSDVAKHVADALRVKILSPESERIEKKPTENTTAYTLYLKGRYLWNTRQLDDLKEATECFEQAVRKDPTFALGYGGLADCALLFRNNWGMDLDENLEKARQLSAKALELDSQLAEIHATKGLVHSTEFDFGLAEAEFKRAIELKPSYAAAHMWYYQVLCTELRWDEALEQIERTVELDPLSNVAYFNLGNFYFARREFEKALDPFTKAAELGNLGAHGMAAAAYGMMKRYDDMRRENSIVRDWGRKVYPQVDLGTELFEAYLQGDKESVKRRLPELETVFREAGLACYNVACFHFFLGDIDRGFEWLERSFDSREFALTNLQSDWDLDGVRTDPRYPNLLKRMGLDHAVQPK